MALVPLRARDGSIKAYALIDVADAQWVNQWRWSLMDGYAVRAEGSGKGQIKIRLHREILGLPRVSDGRDGDHIDRDTLNDRRSNLRVVTSAQNAQNRRKLDGFSSKYRGVHWNKRIQKWVARVGVNRERVNVGVFDSEDAAGEAARAARLRLQPFATD